MRSAENCHAYQNPAPPSSSSRPSTTKFGLVDPSIYDKVFTESDRKKVKLKVKKAAPKQSNPGTWNDENKVEGAPSAKDKADAASPLINPVDDKIAAAFPTNKPYEDQPELVSCKHCKRPVLRIAAAAHIRECLKKKQEKLQKKKEAKEAKDAALRKERNGGVSPAPSDDGLDDRARKSATAVDGAAKKSGKKRKADDDAKGASAKKKKKEDPKAKAGKAKGPVDVEKQCGVVLNNGCAMC
jgi:SAGA-associated factor 73